jgi:hypothetical protein
MPTERELNDTDSYPQISMTDMNRWDPYNKQSDEIELSMSIYNDANYITDKQREINHVCTASVCLTSKHLTLEDMSYMIEESIVVPDQQFYRCIECIQYRYETEEQEITYARLMQLAVNMYDLIAQRNAIPRESVERSWL